MMREPRPRLWDRLEDFWLGHISTARFALLRAALGATVFLWGLTLAPDLLAIFGDGGFADGVPLNRSKVLVLFRYIDGNTAVVASYVLLMLGSVALIVGRFTRLALPVVALLLITFTTVGAGFFIGTENVMRVLAVELALFAALTPSPYLDRSALRAGGPATLPAWGVRLVQVQMTILYATTAIAKWQGEAWRDGVAVLDALTPVHTLRFSVPSALTESDLFVSLLTWGVLGFETLLPFLLWHPRTRRTAVMLAFLAHLGFGLFIELGLFPLAMAVGLCAFLSDSDAERLAIRARSRVAATRVRVI